MVGVPPKNSSYAILNIYKKGHRQTAPYFMLMGYDYLPWKFLARLFTNASMPSFWSAVEKHSAKTSSS